MRTILVRLVLFGMALLVGNIPAIAADAPAKKHILFILTSHNELLGTGKKTGFWFDELATPYYAFRDAGYSVSLASISGGEPPVDPRSTEEKSASVQRFMKDQEAMQQLENTSAVHEVKADDYEAVFLTGGHGVLWDCVDNAVLNALLQHFVSGNKLIIAIDHAPAELMQLTGVDGPWVKGRKMAAFTKEEEEMLGIDSTVPLYADRSLEKVGAKIIRAKPFQPQAVKDGNLITGQNPASTAKVTKLALEALKHS